jgi:chromosome segregation ATPase
MELIKITNINNELLNRDNKFISIQKQLEAKRELLLNKQNRLKKLIKENQYLNEIKDDYSKYYGYIINQKKQQIQALEMLNKYIEDLTISGNLTEKNIEDAKYEKKIIKKELNKIKANLDELIDFTES